MLKYKYLGMLLLIVSLVFMGNYDVETVTSSGATDIIEIDNLPYQSGSPRLKDFKGPGELKLFLENDKTDTIPAFFKLGSTTFRFYCMDFAEILRDHLNEAGYYANIQCFGSGTKLPNTTKILNTAHVMVSVRIDESIWLIEPQKDEYWKAWDIHLMEVRNEK